MSQNLGVLDQRPLASNITAADVGSSTGSGQSSASIITGTPTAASYVGQGVDGVGAWRVQISGTFSATLQFEGSVDGGVTWSPLSALVQGTSVLVSSVTGVGIFLIPITGLTNIRVRCTAFTSGTAVITSSIANNAAVPFLVAALASMDIGDVTLLAGEAFVGLVGTPAFKQTDALTTTNGAYSASDYVGAKVTLSNIARVALGKVLLQSVAVEVKSNQTGALTLLIFDADPSSTTIADNGALAINAADVFKVKAAIPITQTRNLGTGTLYTADGLGILLQPASGRDLYYVLVTDTAWTLTSTADASVDIKALQVS